MKRTYNGKVLFAFSLLLLAAAAFADVPQALTYRGVLRRSGGGEQTAGSLELTFRLYDSKTPGTALWARTVRVPIDTNGVFYAELNDRRGTTRTESGARSPTRWAWSRARRKSA